MDHGEATHGTIVTSIIKSQKDVIGAAPDADVLTIGIDIDKFNKKKESGDLTRLCDVIDQYRPNIISISASIDHFLNDEEGFKKFRDLIVKNDCILVLASGNGSGTYRLDPKYKNKLFRSSTDMDDLTDLFNDGELIKRVIIVGAATHKYLLNPIEYFIDNHHNIVHKFWFREYNPEPANIERAKWSKKFERCEEIFQEINHVLEIHNKSWHDLFEIEPSSFYEAEKKSIMDNENNYLRIFGNSYNENITNNLITLSNREEILGAFSRDYPTFNQHRIDGFKTPQNKKNYYPRFIKMFALKMDMVKSHIDDIYLLPISNRAGVLKDHFITAISDKARVLSFEIKNDHPQPIIVHKGGSTSLSVPFVTSALALIFCKYPNHRLSAAGAINVLYENAIKTDKPDVFGQGILNLHDLK